MKLIQVQGMDIQLNRPLSSSHKEAQRGGYVDGTVGMMGEKKRIEYCYHTMRLVVGVTLD